MGIAVPTPKASAEVMSAEVLRRLARSMTPTAVPWLLIWPEPGAGNSERSGLEYRR